jgi:hypothetical protein
MNAFKIAIGEIMKEPREMSIKDIELKLEDEWADWDDNEDGRINIRKRELMYALQKIEDMIDMYQSKIAAMLAIHEGYKETNWTCGDITNGPGDDYCETAYRSGDAYCDTCLRNMKVKLLKLSRLLSDADMKRVYVGNPINLW